MNEEMAVRGRTHSVDAGRATTRGQDGCGGTVQPVICEFSRRNLKHLSSSFGSTHPLVHVLYVTSY